MEFLVCILKELCIPKELLVEREVPFGRTRDLPDGTLCRDSPSAAEFRRIQFAFPRMGLRRLLLADKPSDQGRILENTIYLELKRRYREVFVGTLGANEIDFVALENAVPHYYQVALTTREESTLLRELAPLKAIRDNHPKTLLTLDRDPPANFDGIKKIRGFVHNCGSV